MALVRVFCGHDITISGTPLDPLFPANTIAKILDDHNIRRYLSSVRMGAEYVVVDGVSYLTEAGLYKYLMRSRNNRAEEFQDYVCAVLKCLRLDGKVELQNRADDALLRAKVAESNCREANKKLADTAKALALAREHSRLLEASRGDRYRYRVDSDPRDFASHYIDLFIYEHKFKWGANGGINRLPEDFTRESIPTKVLDEIYHHADDLFIWRNDDAMMDLVAGHLSKYLMGSSR